MIEPADFLFYNKVMDRIAIRQIINRLITHFGIAHTTHVLDQLKTLGFQQATSAAVSLGIDDLLTTPSKNWLIKDAEQYSNLSEKQHNYGNLHAVEKPRQLIETWYATSEYLKQGMNPNFRITDPLNPVHMMSFSGARGSISQVHQLVGMRGLMSDPQGQIIDLPIQSNFREGLSLTEYIISCYGARKGVVDTAVRTSDAGYLTRRLVEVVQRIVVCKPDCGTTSGIYINQHLEKKNTSYQKLIGRVLAENVYKNNRCFGIRNQDIGNLLASRIIASETEPICVRSPLTCKGMLWVCQLCYGWSLTNGKLIEIGEAVGIIAGQSIGEPGTQLTLRTFHTGGVFTGDIAEHVRTPFNGIIKFDEGSVFPTRTRHGHPAWVCHTSLFLRIQSRNKIHNSIIPPNSLLLVQNNQYIKSKQIIAEIRAKTSPPKERICKYIYANLSGEMYWIAGVQHTSEYMHSFIHPTLRTSHIWILAGRFYSQNHKLVVSSSFYKNQDRINSNTLITKGRSLPSFLSSKNQLNICIFNSYISKKNRVFKKRQLTFTIFNGSNASLNCNIILYSYHVVKKRKNLFLKEIDTNLSFFLEIQKNGVLRNNDSFAITDHPKYELKKSGIMRYGTIVTDSSNVNNDSRHGKTRFFRSTFEIVKGGNFFFLPEEVYGSIQTLSSISIKNNDFVQIGELITSTNTSSISGLVRIKKRINNTYEVKILPGAIHYPNQIYKLSEQVGILIPPGKKIFDKFQCHHWIYFQWIMPFKEKPFALLRPTTEYSVSDGFSKTNLLRLLERDTNLKIRTVNYLLYSDGEQIQIVNEKHVRLLRTRLIICWKKSYFSERAHVSFLEVQTRNRSKNYFQIGLIDCFSLNKKEEEKTFYSQNILRKNCYDDFFLICRNRLINKYKGIIRISSNKKSDFRTSFIVLSPMDFVKVSKKNESRDSITKCISNCSSVEFFDFRDRRKNFTSIRNKDEAFLGAKEKCNRIISFNEMGIIGNSRNGINTSECLYWVTSETMLYRSSMLDQFRNILQNPDWFFVDEYNEIHSYFFGKKMNRKSFRSLFPLFDLSSEKTKNRNLGQFFFDNFLISKEEITLSGQITNIDMDCSTIRIGKPHLANKGAIIHNNCGGSIKEGDTLITFIYERLKSGDIIQGLPKVEQLLEARSVNSVSMDLDNGFKDWNNDMKRFVGNLWGFFLSVKITTEQGQIILVDQIRKVYKSQGVHISNKHIEIIVRQMTSRVSTSEDGIIDIFSPGELIEFSRAQRMNRILDEAIPYEPILLGITKASLNTQSFISEASFQETTRVLARAALRGRIDWLKGLKENIIIGGVIPAGTGSREIIWRRLIEKRGYFYFGNGKNYFDRTIRNIFLYRNAFFVSPGIETVRNVLKESTLIDNRNAFST